MFDCFWVLFLSSLNSVVQAFFKPLTKVNDFSHSWIKVDFVSLPLDLFAGLDEAGGKPLDVNVWNQLFEPVSVGQIFLPLLILLKIWMKVTPL